MRIPLISRVACACVAATLGFPLALAPSYARMGGPVGGSFARPGVGVGRVSHFAPHGLNQRFEAGRFGFNRFYGNPLLLGGFGWGGWGWGGYPVSSEPPVVDEGAPVIINISVEPGQGDAGSALSGSCVIHKLNYDSNGKYVGERQIPHC